MFVKERIIDTMADQREARGLTPERESPQVLAGKAKAQKKGRGVKAEPKIEAEGGDPVERRESVGNLRVTMYLTVGCGAKGIGECQQSHERADHHVPGYLSYEVSSC
jgi:hypothetical protein